MRQRGEEDADVTIRAPPSPLVGARCRVGLPFVGNGRRRPAAAGSGWGTGSSGGGAARDADSDEREGDDGGRRLGSCWPYPMEARAKMGIQKYIYCRWARICGRYAGGVE